MNEKEKIFLEESFKKYYFQHFDMIHVPQRSNEREFGYQKFDHSMIRHLSIKNDNDLRLLLMQTIPSDIYCSNGYYSFPNLPMNEKDWKGADLIFDIDAKDLGLECRKDHTCIICQSCNTVSKFQEICPNCSSMKISEQPLTCKNCIDSSKTQLKNLIDILVKDLGINIEKISSYYSGHEGFHIHVIGSTYESLDSRERTDLVSYLSLKDLIPETLGIKKFNFKKSELPTLDEQGWRGRIAKNLFGTKSKRPKMISQIIDDGYDSFKQKLDIISFNLGIKIDPNVTIDIHRIFRMPGSINSKSGLSKTSVLDIDKFDPFTEACLISDDPIDIIANCPITFTLKNKKYGNYNNEKIEVPRYAAVYLICKDMAKLV